MNTFAIPVKALFTLLRMEQILLMQAMEVYMKELQFLSRMLHMRLVRMYMVMQPALVLWWYPQLEIAD